MTSSFTLCQNHISENVALFAQKISWKASIVQISTKFQTTFFIWHVCVTPLFCQKSIVFIRCGIKNRYKIGRDISMCKNDQIVKLLLHSFYYEILLFRYGRIYSLFGHDVIADWWNRYLVYTLAGYYNGLRFVHSEYTYLWSLFQITVT